MKKIDNIRVYAWIELIVWLLIIALCVFGIRYHNYQKQKQFKHYQIFMQDADGLIVGSPVKFLGIQIGHVTKIQIISSDVSDIYVKFIITQKDLTLPTGAIATVEGSGLGGSKALEIYPPQNKQSDKIIETKDSTRLGKVMSLFKTMFVDFDEIFTNIGNVGKQLYTPETVQSMKQNVVAPAQANDTIDILDRKLDKIIIQRQELKKKLNKMKIDRDNLNIGGKKDE